MNNEFIFDESEQAGFRLNTLQLYNWGILQNDKIFTFDFDDKSTLLTGRNGSGKRKQAATMTMGRLARGLRNNNPGNIRRVRG